MKVEFLKHVERWGIFELSVQGHAEGNPFLERTITGTFEGENETVQTEGFYDGDGIYRIRFMPSFEGVYRFRIGGNFAESELTGEFRVTAASEKNHGPVRVSHQYHFSYEDGTSYFPVGTTCYVWHLQSLQIQNQTLASLKESAFNKIRFCVFPKHYQFNTSEPDVYPFEGKPADFSELTADNFFRYNCFNDGNSWNFEKPNPEYFRRIERRIADLQALGIEADLILMHPYDRWGFSNMPREANDRYLRYVLARFSAFRNVWWSLSNEYDYTPTKTMEDWEHFAQIICRSDPYHHLRSIHNGSRLYDFHRPWITHCSVQRVDIYRTVEDANELRSRFGKPVVFDEISYEGNLQFGWGNIDGEEMTRRFWEAFVRGGYPGHGETYLEGDLPLWWSHGGQLRGTSPKRIAFLRKIMEETPGPGMEPLNEARYWDVAAGCAQGGFGPRNDYVIFYFSFMQPSYRDFFLDDATDYRVELIDTWNMTITDCGIHRGAFRLDLPGRKYMAVRFRKETA